MKIIVLFACILSTTGCASVDPARWGDAGQIADLASTVYMLECDDFAEDNPVVGDLSTVGIIVVKVVGNLLLYELADRVPAAYDEIHYLRAVLGFAAAGYNLEKL